MNRKGFTILELLSVLGIIGAVGVIGVISYTYIMDDSFEKEYSVYIKTIENAACSYASVVDLRQECLDPNNCNIDVNKSLLIEKGYLDKKYANTISDMKIPSYVIKVTWDEDGNKVCEYNEKDK